MKTTLTLFVIAASIGVSFADEADRAKLLGAWQLGDKDSATVWLFEEKGDKFHVLHSQDGSKVSEFDCNTIGKECEVKISGKPAKVTMYYNGSKLVQMEIRGDEVIKRHFSASGDTLEVESIPIAPPGKPEKATLKRAPDPLAANRQTP